MLLLALCFSNCFRGGGGGGVGGLVALSCCLFYSSRRVTSHSYKAFWKQLPDPRIECAKINVCLPRTPYFKANSLQRVLFFHPLAFDSLIKQIKILQSWPRFELALRSIEGFHLSIESNLRFALLRLVIGLKSRDTL